MTAERATILVADDEPHIRRILQYLLEQAGYDVVVAADGEDALREVDRCAPDLVLLDVMMPRLDGFSVLRSIRASLETARLPVILLTAKGQSDEKVKGLRGGANDYIIKPFDQEELLLRIHNMLEHARAQREANPLTGLPGNLAIAREATRASRPATRSRSCTSTSTASRASTTPTATPAATARSRCSRVLCDAVRSLGVADAFVGHVGGDDFILMAPTTRAEELACRIVRDFDAGVPALHDADDAARGYLEIRTRSGAPSACRWSPSPWRSSSTRTAASPTRRLERHPGRAEALRQDDERQRRGEGTPRPADSHELVTTSRPAARSRRMNHAPDDVMVRIACARARERLCDGWGDARAWLVLREEVARAWSEHPAVRCAVVVVRGAAADRLAGEEPAAAWVLGSADAGRAQWVSPPPALESLWQELDDAGGDVAAGCPPSCRAASCPRAARAGSPSACRRGRPSSWRCCSVWRGDQTPATS